MNLTPEEQQLWDTTLANMFSNPKYVDYLFYAHLLAQCKIHFDRTMQAPAGVNFTYDHFNLYINPSIEISLEKEDGTFPLDGKGNEIKSVPGFNGYPMEQRMGIIKHEMLHLLLGHTKRKQDRNHEGFNIAADCALNQLIERSHLPSECIYPDQFPSHDGNPVPPNLSAEQYYELLKFDENGNRNGGSGAGNGVLDDHSKWDESVGDEELQDDIAKNMLEKAVDSTNKSRGNVPGQISEWLDRLTKKREVDWRQVFKRLTGNKPAYTRKTLMKPDRRQPNFAWIKGKKKNRVGVPVIIGDESGSVSDEELTGAIGECLHICKTLSTDLWYVPVDTQAHKPHIIKSNQKSFQRVACGGTILAPAVDKICEAKLECNALVIITDGGICDSDVDAFATMKVPTIWLITSAGETPSTISQYPHMRSFKLKPQE